MRRVKIKVMRSPDLDGQWVFVRRHLEIARRIIVDQGGADCCSETRKQLIARFGAAAAFAEQLEARLAHGDVIDLKDYASLCATMVSIARYLFSDQAMRDSKSPLMPYLNKLAEMKPNETPRQSLPRNVRYELVPTRI